jgi:hypothetical protein
LTVDLNRLNYLWHNLKQLAELQYYGGIFERSTVALGRLLVTSSFDIICSPVNSGKQNYRQFSALW